MAKYSVELNELIDNNIKIFPDNYKFYTDDIQAKEEFEMLFKEHYYFDEIGFETIGRFQQRLQARLNLKSDYWKKLYETELATQGIEFLLNKDLKETFERTLDNVKTGEEKNTGTIGNVENLSKNINDKEIFEDSKTENSKGTSKNDTTSNDRRENNSKQSNIGDGLADANLSDGSLTNVENNIDLNNTTSNDIGENTTESTSTQNSTNTKEISDNSNNTNTQTNDLTKTLNDNEKITETTTLTSKGNIGTTSSAELLVKWREVIISMNELIIKDCRDLFMVIY